MHRACMELDADETGLGDRKVGVYALRIEGGGMLATGYLVGGWTGQSSQPFTAISGKQLCMDDAALHGEQTSGSRNGME